MQGAGIKPTYHSKLLRELQAKSPGRTSSSLGLAGLLTRTLRDWLEWNGYRVYTQHDSTHVLFRKEVIQPQVLLRLPCYDFTPIMDHTLGRCLPCGSACRLLVQSTFVM